MHLKRLSLINYKNIKELEIELSPKINCFIGNNGMGKTNLLDAVYYLSFCKSYFSSTDQLNIKHDELFMVLEGNYQRKEMDELIYCGLKRGQKKNFKRNKKEYKKLSEHIGLLPIVMVSPADVRLITDGSEERRKYMDSVISQYDRKYLDDLIRYNRVILQRNKLLKDFARRGKFEEDSLSIWDEQMVILSASIYEKRKDFLNKLMPVFQEYYNIISQGNERVTLEYKSQLNAHSMRDLLRHARLKDQVMQYTTVGIHKDDLILSLGDYPIKKMGSQGQQKTYLIALKLAQFEFIKKLSEYNPILLLDDIFDKLDAERVEQIVHLVSEERFGQIFISDTNRDHLDQILSSSNLTYKLFGLNNGSVVGL
ncbi:DNA replication/repair protein RecF [Ancylomarina salipaludis]|uniref:DNA replication and repair protein RecF n=1 Tax=Ancylomarina salipaludis TaxID=2501299 RepID=A0A4Q1JN69_9BACT|nr:DNA replication/repair protein RecF [Ancylomarina salipaludis]RXQ96149.1 DNA replication/repair protein RecF [Ancylomarina salipaludis]